MQPPPTLPPTARPCADDKATSRIKDNAALHILNDLNVHCHAILAFTE